LSRTKEDREGREGVLARETKKQKTPQKSSDSSAMSMAYLGFSRGGGRVRTARKKRRLRHNRRVGGWKRKLGRESEREGVQRGGGKRVSCQAKKRRLIAAPPNPARLNPVRGSREDRKLSGKEGYYTCLHSKVYWG